MLMAYAAIDPTKMARVACGAAAGGLALYAKADSGAGVAAAVAATAAATASACQ